MLCETVSTLYSFFSKKEGAWFPFNKVCAKSMRKTPPLKVCVFQNRHPVSKTFNKFNVKKVTSPSFVLYPSHCRLHRTKTRGKNKTVSTVSTQAMAPWSFQACLSGSGRTSSNLEFCWEKKRWLPKRRFLRSKSLPTKNKTCLSLCLSIFHHICIYIYM